MIVKRQWAILSRLHLRPLAKQLTKACALAHDMKFAGFCAHMTAQNTSLSWLQISAPQTPIRYNSSVI